MNLARGLGLAVEVSAPKPAMAAEICRHLGVDWDSSCWSAGQTITLEGFNRILLGAEAHIAHQRRAPQLELFETVEPVSDVFVPARSKLEAVTRMSALTGSPPETLGPGSKERRSALVNLAIGLGLSVDSEANKPVLGARICADLDLFWDDSCWSTGHTITLVGLNRLLEGAERRLASQRGQGGLFSSAKAEARALLTALREALPRHMDGRVCVTQMRGAEYSQWAQDEWAGFYFEFIGLPALVNAFGGGPREVGSTRFDYALGHTWDLKVHMTASGTAPLNDQASMETAINAGGVGFLVLTGDADYDGGEFRLWQREYRLQHGKRARERTTPPAYVRRSKRAFTPFMIEAFYFADRSTLEQSLSSGVLQLMKQGRQTSGRPRQPKYAINLVKARASSVLLGQAVL